MDSRPIGVFDSGLGGLSVVRHLLDLMPQENIVYFGDTGRVPYGTRSEDTIRRYAQEDSSFLLGHDVKAVVAACGTVSSVAADVLASLPVPALGVVECTAAAAVAATRNRRVGVMGTSATVRSGSFARAMQALDPSVAVTAVACPMLVSLVESGWIDPSDAVAVALVDRYLEPLRAAGVDTIILGCTHFPLLAPVIRARLGEQVCLIDSGRETARGCAAMLREANALADRGCGKAHYYVSDRPDGFARVAEVFLGRSVSEDVEMILPEAISGAGKG